MTFQITIDNDDCGFYITQRNECKHPKNYREECSKVNCPLIFE